jgi:Uncharacterized protein conserved in archaea|uniref:DUF2139 domain-containing protein n=1 Tax=Ignisphaera aggregans TaxID=334771 RepID=A0A7J3Z7I4_9CREN
MGYPLNLKRFIIHEEVGMGQNQFRCFYIGFHPVSSSMIIHEGHSGRVYMDGRLIYGYELIGRPPRAGGDTHAAMAWSKDLLFFGGWIKAPPGLLISTDRTLAKQDMREKYSHIHMVEDGGRVSLLWSRKWDEKIAPNHWYGEVTDLLYDGHEDVLYFSRGDGYAELGLWRIQLSSGKVEWIIRDRTVYKMEMKDDKVFATIFNPAHMEKSAIVIYDTLSGESRIVEEFEFVLDKEKKVSIARDGGQIVQLQNRLVAFYGGFFIVVDPYRDRYTMYPFLEVAGSRENAVIPMAERPLYIPGLRTQKVYPLGVPIVAANPCEASTEPLHKTTFGLLFRFDPVAPQILTSTGFVSGMATDGYNLYMGVSYANHCPAYTYRSGDGGVHAVPLRDVFSKPWVPIRMWVYDGSYRSGESGLFGWFGGIPLKGFSVKKLRIYSSEEAKLSIAEYSLLGNVVEEEVALRSGWNTVDMGALYDIAAFKLKNDVQRVLAEVVLEP